LFSWYEDESDFVNWLLELDFKYITLTNDLFYSIGFRVLTTFYIETKKEIQMTDNKDVLKLLDEFYNKAKNYYEQQNKNYMVEQEVEI
jgi:lysyl-tRNA synthetase class I